MKTIKLRLLATMITLAAVTITTTNPALAQRRSTSTENTRNESVVKSSTSKKSVEKGNTNRTNNSKSNADDRGNKQSDQSKRSTVQGINQKQQQSSDRTDRNVRTESKTTRVTTESTSQKPQTTRENKSNSTVRNTVKSSGTVTNNNRSTTSQPRRETSTERTVTRSTNQETVNSRNRSTTDNITRNTREKYRIDENDRRYAPSRDYRGSNSYWSGNDRPDKMNYNRDNKKFYRDYDYKTYLHWDRRWENYRWNLNSWRDYYSGYNPYSYRYYRYYYHHPHYGEVIRRFIDPPLVFVHNQINYYCYDGHFFRYHSGIGYVLVDMPYGMVFDYIPVGYERVYINGYPYFRVGNLFFEFDNFGFHLIHYPERYFSINISFSNNGFIF